MTLLVQANTSSRYLSIARLLRDLHWQAYNTYGGVCLYGTFGSRWCDPGAPRSYVASYNRPLVTRDYRAINAPFGAEYPLIRFLEQNGYDVAYQSGLDTHLARGLVGPQLFISVGHDEYWSGPQRTAVEAARDRGVNLAFMSGHLQLLHLLQRLHAKRVLLGNFLAQRFDVCDSPGRKRALFFPKRL
jgi:hypothetical protein